VLRSVRRPTQAAHFLGINAVYFSGVLAGMRDEAGISSCALPGL
jgi:hypothetical protein